MLVDTKDFDCPTCKHHTAGKCDTWCENGEQYSPNMNALKPINAITVVRCKDCKYRYKPDDDPAYKTLPVRPDAIWCYWVDGNDDWFCPYGIRKDDDR